MHPPDQPLDYLPAAPHARTLRAAGITLLPWATIQGIAGLLTVVSALAGLAASASLAGPLISPEFTVAAIVVCAIAAIFGLWLTIWGIGAFRDGYALIAGKPVPLRRHLRATRFCQVLLLLVIPGIAAMAIQQHVWNRAASDVISYAAAIAVVCVLLTLLHVTHRVLARAQAAMDPAAAAVGSQPAGRGSGPSL